jgi:hypothetical protein
MNLGMVESIIQLEAVGVSMVLVLFSPVRSIPVVVLRLFRYMYIVYSYAVLKI